MRITLLTFGVSATDPNGTTPTLSTSALPTGASFVDNGNGTGTFNWTPTFAQAGSYPVTFRASDGTLLDSQIVTITVNFVNAPPALAVIGNKSVNENTLLTFGVSATDPNGTTPTLSTSALPTGASFVDNGNGTGTFNWTPTFAQAGSYPVTFRASDGTLIDSQVVTITVVGVNVPPVLATIGNKSVNDGSVLSFVVTATDPNGTIPSLSTSALPTGATFVDSLNGHALFNWRPNYAQAGSYNVTFHASDGSLSDSQVVTITVAFVNVAPKLAAIGNQTANEGQLLTFGVSAVDSNGTIPTLTATALPTGAGFVDHANGTGTFTWTPGFTQAGSYNVVFHASDGTLVDSQIVTVTVVGVNVAPKIAAIGNKSVNDGSVLSFVITATDSNGTIPALSATGLPTGATFADSLNGHGLFNWRPNYAQAGSYNVTFHASDGSLSDSQVVTITVAFVNVAPKLAAIGNQTANEGQLLTFGVSAVDSNGTIPTLSATSLPTGAGFVDHANGTGTFTWTPGFTQAGSYNVVFHASDGTLVDSQIVTVTVVGVNVAPKIAAIGNKSVNDGSVLSFVITATDSNGTIPALSATGLPAGATFADSANGHGLFDWRPNYAQAGSYNVTFHASDGSLADSQIVTITVNFVNVAPKLAAIGSQTATEGQLLTFGVSAIDSNGTIPTLSATGLPAGAAFVDSANGRGLFSWKPGFTQAGSYNVVLHASDGTLVDSQIVAITVVGVNLPPIIAAIGNKSVNDGSVLSFVITATDSNGTIPTLSAASLPTGATFADSANGHGLFNWRPNYAQAGSYNVTFHASDGSLSDSQVVTITVNFVNVAPTIAAIGNKSVNEGTALSFTISAVDSNGTIPALTATGLPTGATFADSANGHGLFNWRPSYAQAGSYNVVFHASDGTLLDSQVVTITVAFVNVSPKLAAIGNKVAVAGTPLNFVVTAVDSNGTIPILTTSALPANASFVDNHNGTGNFSFTPIASQAGPHNITFYASDSLLVDSQLVMITVTIGGNLPPIFATMHDTAVDEGATLVLTVSASDPDGGGAFPKLSATSTLKNFTFVDNKNGTGTLTYNPNFFNAGVDTVHFFATDILNATSIFSIRVTTNDVNQPPKFLAVSAKSVRVGDTLSFNIAATDSTDPLWPRRVFLSMVTAPSGAGFVDNQNSTGKFTFTPGPTQVAVDTIQFAAVDQGVPPLSANLAVVVTVQASAVPPVMNLASNVAEKTTEGQVLTVPITATDADGSIPVISADSLPANAVLNQVGPGSATFVFSPSFVQGDPRSKLYTVVFKASNGAAFTKSTMTIQVLDAGPQKPIFDSIPANPTLVAGTVDSFSVHAVDPDTMPVTLAAFLSTLAPLPTSFTFVDLGKGLGKLKVAPTFAQFGTYNIVIVANNGRLTDTLKLVVTVLKGANQPPILAAIGNKTAKQLQGFNFLVSATDADGTFPQLIATNMPAAASFTDHNNGTGTFSWIPTLFDTGKVVVTFHAIDTDTTGVADSAAVTLTVLDTVIAPSFIVPGTVFGDYERGGHPSVPRFRRQSGQHYSVIAGRTYLDHRHAGHTHEIC